jgi:4-hydroxy-tetrahydrodipicolinate synthase
MPALTTAFDKNLQVDLEFVARHARWQIENGVSGLVALGSLGEAATLPMDEKLAIIETLVGTVEGKVPVVAAVSALSTDEAVALAQRAEEQGAKGLMILPPYVYQGDWAEMKAHVAAVLEATVLPAMLYNNPVAYGTDFTPEQIQELAAEFHNLQAVKESSTDVRRVTAIRALTGDRLAVFVGVDDAIVEGIGAGAVGWIAGLVNALPRESVDLFEWARAGKGQDAFELYRWFLPLLRMDTVPKFVQLIKLVQQELGVGSARVRSPRRELTGAELEAARETVRIAMARRPRAARSSTQFRAG